MDFVIFSINNWEKRKARKQQFALALSQRQDVERVLYVEPALNFWRLIFLPWKELATADNRLRWLRALLGKTKIVNEKLLVFTPIVFVPFGFRFQAIYNWNTRWVNKVVARQAKNSKETVLWLYQPLDYKLLEYFKPRRLVIFDWAEEWADYFVEFDKKKRNEIKTLEEKIIKNVGLVFVVSKIMLDTAKRFNKNSYYLYDGVTIEVFQDMIEKITSDMKDIPGPIAGYIGTVSHRVDIKLLDFLSDYFPKLSFVFIGDIHFDRVNISCLINKKNVFFLKGKDYKELGKYTKRFDLTIIPYKPELTPQLPTKIFDYFAIGKPVVSTNCLALQEFKDYIYIADSQQEFIEAVNKALQENSQELENKRKIIAKSNSWQARAQEIINYINKTSL